MFLYAFDTLGIIYTVASGVLILLLLAAVINISVKKKPCTKGTVLFRVLDIVLCSVLLGAWILFALTYTVALPVQLLGITLIWASGLGILLISLTTALAATALALAFALRRKDNAPVPVKSEDVLPAEGQNMLFELMANLGDGEENEQGAMPSENKRIPRETSAAYAEIKIKPIGKKGADGAVMRKVTIEKRGEATNMFNNYLDEKEPKEREILENSIDEITIK